MTNVEERENFSSSHLQTYKWRILHQPHTLKSELYRRSPKHRSTVMPLSITPQLEYILDVCSGSYWITGYPNSATIKTPQGMVICNVRFKTML